MPKAKVEQRREVVEPLPGWSFSMTDFEHDDLTTVIARLQKIVDGNPGKRLKMRIEQEAYSDYQFYQVVELRPENDEEFSARQAHEAEVRARQEDHERQEFERLRKKFKSGP